MLGMPSAHIRPLRLLPAGDPMRKSMLLKTFSSRQTSLKLALPQTRHAGRSSHRFLSPAALPQQIPLSLAAGTWLLPLKCSPSVIKRPLPERFSLSGYNSQLSEAVAGLGLSHRVPRIPPLPHRVSQNQQLHCTQGSAGRPFRTQNKAMAPEDNVVSAVPELKSHVASNGVGVITLDRPKALNAMNLGMDEAFSSLQGSWEKDKAVKAVLVEGSTPRAFCSGGDVKWMTTIGREQHGMSHVAAQVFAVEYALICKIARLAAPYVALMDGVTMGFGVGLSGHGRYRVATERSVVAMPENGIGLFPDVGFAHLVARSPGRGALGAYLALTGARVLTPADALFAGLATHYVPSEKLPQLRESLLSADLAGDADAGVEGILRKFSKLPEKESKLKKLLPVIESTFGCGKSVPAIVSSLEELEASRDSRVAEWAKEALQGISKGAPFSLAVTHHHFAEVAAAANEEPAVAELAKVEGVMRREYRLAVRVACRPDFTEGVRAVLVDKDQEPRWQPATYDEVDLEEVRAAFAPLQPQELELHV